MRRGHGGRRLLIALTGLLLAATGRMVQTQTARTLTWDQTSAATGFAVTVDGVRNNVGVTPVASNGTCGCSIPAWFIGTRHQVIVSAYNAAGETSAPPIIVGPTAAAGGPYQGVVGSLLSVTGAASVDATAAITRYDWTWGDGTGSSSALAAAVHIYASAGTYNITLTVTDADGASDATTMTATIIAALPTLPSVPGAPSPAGGALAISTSVTLTWSAGLATGYDVYFGTTNPPPLVSAAQAAALYTPPAPLAASTSYFWKIVARNSQGATTGPVWTFTTAAAAAPSTGPVAAYGFSEGSGTTTADASGNGNGGLLANSPTWTTGKNGSALSFNGSTTYVDLSNPTSLRLTGSMTLSAWVYETANVGDDGQIIAKSDGAAGWQLKSTPDTGARTFGIAISNSSGGRIQRYSKTARALNTWYYVAGVYDAAARTLNIYVNGVLDNGTLSGAVPSSQFDSPVSVNVGRRSGGFNLAGRIDDVRVYNRALAQTEIQADMNTPANGLPATPGAPGAPTPTIGATNVSLGVTLTWAASAGATSYDVRLGTSNPPPGVSNNRTGTTYQPVALTAGTTYYWQIVANGASGSTSGPVWNFTTVPPASAPAPSVPWGPVPWTGATGVSTTTVLNWSPSTNATQYDVKFGGTNPPAVVSSNQTGTSYQPAALTASTTYYWQVVAKGAGGSTSGPVWRLTTAAVAAGPAPVAAYAFNEGAGTTASDASGNGRTGSLKNATWTAAGKNGGALSFNGISSRVTVPDAATLHLSGAMTLEAWVNPSTTGVPHWQAIIYKGVDNFFLATLWDTTRPTAGGTVGGGQAQVTAPNAIPMNAWTHLAVTYDGATVRLFVNGTQVDNHPATGLLAVSSSPLEIGGSLVDQGPFAGLIDDVRVYNTALTTAQIQTDMTTPVR